LEREHTGGVMASRSLCRFHFTASLRTWESGFAVRRSVQSGFRGNGPAPVGDRLLMLCAHRFLVLCEQVARACLGIIRSESCSEARAVENFVSLEICA
jgi:hypothetical protein